MYWYADRVTCNIAHIYLQVSQTHCNNKKIHSKHWFTFIADCISISITSLGKTDFSALQNTKYCIMLQHAYLCGLEEL